MNRNLRNFLSTVIFPARLVAFWLLFFAVFRLWFVLQLRGKWSAEQPGSVWRSFWEALPLDLSTAGYLVALPMLIFFAASLAGVAIRQGLERVIFWFNVLLINVLVLLFGANVFLYEEWQTLLNRRALAYFQQPGALFDSMSPGFLLLSVGLYLGFVWVWVKIYGRFVPPPKPFKEGVSPQEFEISPFQNAENQPVPSANSPIGGQGGGRQIAHLLSFLLQLLLLFYLIRGGTGRMPINESEVYYSTHLFNNHAATNTAWRLVHSLVEAQAERNPFVFFENKNQAGALVSQLFKNKKTSEVPDSQQVFKLEGRPNIVFILMESMTAQVVEELGGEAGVCLNLSRLIREGVLFERVFSSGYRTDQGLVAVLSGYPAQPDQSVVLLEEKAKKLPSLPRFLAENGYQTAFFYGGQLTFANIGTYLVNQGFQKIVSEKNFSRSEIIQKWGADDRTLLDRAATEIGQLREPFFATALTLSLHPPYDVPFSSRWSTSSDLRNQFMNAAVFADDAIGQFFEKAKTQSWFSNTLFVLVADHGSSMPNEVGMETPQSRHVPLIFWGEPLKKMGLAGRRFGAFGNHHDIPATLLGLLHFENQTPDFQWSRNLFSEKPDAGFAFFTNENGLGWATPGGVGFWDFGSKRWQVFRGELSEKERAEGQAFLQVLYDDFLNL